jgi:hypothetical protein
MSTKGFSEIFSDHGTPPAQRFRILDPVKT